MEEGSFAAQSFLGTEGWVSGSLGGEDLVRKANPGSQKDSRREGDEARNMAVKGEHVKRGGASSAKTAEEVRAEKAAP